MKTQGISRSINRGRLYDYSCTPCREDTVSFLLDYARLEKENRESYWNKMRRYYDGDHDIRTFSGEFEKSVNLPWRAAQSTDGYIHVETQIQNSIPDFEFNPRDKTDLEKAKQREKIVKFICDNASLKEKNSKNERSLNIYGSAVFKVCWDTNVRYGSDRADVVVDNPSVYEIYTDPVAKDVDSCEYIAHVYTVHKQKAKRIFAKDFEARGFDISDCIDNGGFFGSFSKLDSKNFGKSDDTVTVTEWWFRQPSDGKCVINRVTSQGVKKVNYEWKCGDIALCVFINGKEVRYVPKFWKNTDFDCYPFVIYNKLPEENSLWGKSELQQIIPLIDAKDRELAFAQLNGAFNSNDIILAEENALCDGETLDNSPGAVWKLRPGMMGKVARLGNGAGAQSSLYSGSAYWQSLIEGTTGNFEVNQGKEPSNVTTATGIALLNERAESRKSIKNIDRNEGFKRLYSILDKMALEFYNDGRIIRMGLSGEDEFVFNFGGFVKKTRDEAYIPSLDITINVGSSVSNSKSFTLSALTTLMNMKITEDNYRFVKAYVQNIGIPQRDAICDYLDEKFGNENKGQIDESLLVKLLLDEKENKDNE